MAIILAIVPFKKSMKNIERVEGRAGADTIRLWEGFREQAYFWRALSLLQMPTTVIAVVAALIMYFYADTTIEVPTKPNPGIYSVKQLPDSEFIKVATEVVNSISSYTPVNAREQFRTSRKYLWEPALSQFEKTMIEGELETIESTSRSQMFFIDPKKIRVDRHAQLDRVVVRLPGVRQKLIGQKAIPADELVYYVKMTTIPRNMHNEYGIVIVDIRVRVAPMNVIAAEDKEVEREEEKAKRLERRGR
jgi:hypothetical protein